MKCGLWRVSGLALRSDGSASKLFVRRLEGRALADIALAISPSGRERPGSRKRQSEREDRYGESG
jgi:hypothetical protein